MSIISRVFNITKANILEYIENFQNYIRDKQEDDTYSSQGYQSKNKGFSDAGKSSKTTYAGVPQQVIEDLDVFGLKPPSSLAEVRSARNREIKKYHSDKFMNDPDKLKTSKEIMQIFNAAYDRLKAYYGDEK